MKKHIQIFAASLIFLGILLIGVSLRFYKLGAIPAGFFCDEASIGYNAYTILTQGKDEFGTVFPVFFRAFGEYKGPIEIYSTVPSIAVFGLNEFATRLPSALYGTLGLIAIFLLTRELFHTDKNKEMLAFLAMFSLAISPWDIHFSRVALEGLMPYVFFTTLASYLFLRAQRNIRFLFPSILCFALAFYSYFPARLFIPALGIGLLIMYRTFLRTHYKHVIFGAILLGYILLPFFQNFFSDSGLARWNQVSIFAHPPTTGTTLEHIASSYFQHFSADFLFLKGDIDMPGQFITRHSVKGFGELFFIQLPFILWAVIEIIRKPTKSGIFLLLWLLLYPLGSMFTLDNTPQATRSIIGVIPLQILTAMGMVHLIRRLQAVRQYFSDGVIVLTGIAIILSVFTYTQAYVTHYNAYSSDFWGWQYGARDVMTYFVAHQHEYHDLVLQPEFNAPSIFLKFYAPQGCPQCSIGQVEDKQILGTKQLFALTPDYLSKHPQYHFKLEHTVYYPNKSIAFEIGEIVQ